MHYRMEPLMDAPEHLAQWMIELEVGKGVGRRHALITDLRRAKTTINADGTRNVTGTRNLALRLDEQPTLENACEAADDIALALLEANGNAQPSDVVLYVIFDGLTEKTADRPPVWQHHFRYVPEPEATASVPWWQVANLDGDNPRRPN